MPTNGHDEETIEAGRTYDWLIKKEGSERKRRAALPPTGRSTRRPGGYMIHAVSSWSTETISWRCIASILLDFSFFAAAFVCRCIAASGLVFVIGR